MTSYGTKILRNYDWANPKKLSKQPIVVQTAFKHVGDVHNNLQFLVATDKPSNVKKQGAFQRCLHALETSNELERDLEWELASNFSRMDLHDPFKKAHANRMAKEVVKNLRHIESPLDEAMRTGPASSGGTQKGNGVNYGDLADEIKLLYERLAI